MLHVVALVAVGAVCFFLGWRLCARKLRKEPTWYVRPHTEETLEEFGYKDVDRTDTPVIVQADFLRANSAGSNSRIR